MEKRKRKVPKAVWIVPLVLAAALLVLYMAFILMWNASSFVTEEEIVYGEYGDEFLHEVSYLRPADLTGEEYRHSIYYKDKALISHSVTSEKLVTPTGIYNENGYEAYFILDQIFYKRAGEDDFYELAGTYDDETKPILYAAVLAGEVKFVEPLIRDGDQEAVDILL